MVNAISYRPTISIVIATYNAGTYFEGLLVSIFNQSYTNIEVIVIDGVSTDSTLSTILKYEKDITYWISEKDEGIYDAWNKGIKKATGDWLCFVGADDFYPARDTIELAIPFIAQAATEDVRFVYGRVKRVADGSDDLIEELGAPWGKVRKELLKNMSIPHPGSFHAKELFKSHGYFDREFKIAGDYEFLLREFAARNRQAIFIDQFVMLNIRDGGVSASFKSRINLIKETARARKKNGLRSYSFQLVFWMVRVRTYIFISKLIGQRFANRIADFYRVSKGKRVRWTK